MRSLKEKFWSKVDKRSDDECWEYQGAYSRGYGRFWDGFKYKLAHRLAWEFRYGQKVPKGMQILHHCDNPKCVNHNHLYCGTQSDNMIDKVVRGRSRSDKLSLSHAKLSAKIILLIREFHNKLSSWKTANKFKVDHKTVEKIWNAKRYPCREGHFVEFGGNCELT